MALYSDERISITYRVVIPTVRLLRLFLHPDEAPHFVTLNILASHVADLTFQECFAALANDHKQIKNRVSVHAGDSFCAANGAAFNEKLHNRYSLFDREIHIS